MEYKSSLLGTVLRCLNTNTTKVWAGVAQLARAPSFQVGSRGFESLRPLQYIDYTIVGWLWIVVGYALIGYGYLNADPYLIAASIPVNMIAIVCFSIEVYREIYR